MNGERDILKEDLRIAYGNLSYKAEEQLIRKINAFRRFDEERAYSKLKFRRSDIEEILRQEKVIGSGLPSRIHFYWILFVGMEFFYHTKLKFKRQSGGTYTLYTRVP